MLSDGFVLENGFCRVVYNTTTRRVQELKGRLRGDGSFDAAPNLVPDTADPQDPSPDGFNPSWAGPGMGLGIEVQLYGAAMTRSISGHVLPSAAVVTTVRNSAAAATVDVSGLLDVNPVPAENPSAVPVLSSTMTFDLEQGSRWVDVTLNATILSRSEGRQALARALGASLLDTEGIVGVSGELGGDAEEVEETSYNLTSMRVGIYSAPRGSVVRLTDGSISDMDHPNEPFYAPTSELSEYVAFGVGQGSLAVSFIKPASTVRDEQDSFLQPMWYAGSWNGARSGILAVWEGVVRQGDWVPGWTGKIAAPPVSVNVGAQYSLTLRLTPSDVPTPGTAVPAAGSLPAAGLPGPWSAAGSDAPAFAYDGVRDVVEAGYFGPLGSIVSHQFAPEGRISPCAYREGGTCYGGNYNFFDPDSFLSVSALMASGDAGNWEQVWRLLETNRGMMCREATSGVCAKGQLPHHLVESCNKVPACKCTTSRTFGTSDCATFDALSGAIQTGPAIFWSLSVLEYLGGSQNASYWADPDVRSDFYLVINSLLAMRPSKPIPFPGNVSISNLLMTTGSLMIDTFRRGNLTADTNSAMPYLLDRVADAEAWAGNSTGEAQLRTLADVMRGEMMALWTSPSANNLTGGHYVTQLNPDLSTRDFVDYDANLFAIAANVSGNPAMQQATLARIDGGPCAHPRATYVSELYYDADNCFLGNTGDSAVTMGRIAWLDARARAIVGTEDAKTAFESRILAPLRSDFRANGWMYERYQCGGQPTHNPYYIEYPEVVAMITHQVDLGVDLRPGRLVVSPIDSTRSFTLPLGTRTIVRSQTAVAVQFQPPTTSAASRAASPVFPHNVEFGGVANGVWNVTLSGASVAGCSTTSVTVTDNTLRFCMAPGTNALSTASAALHSR